MIVGLLGKKGSGKDTLGDHLINNRGFIRYSFADPLKRGCMAMFGFTEEQCFGDKKEVVDDFWGFTPRQALQVVGTELFQIHMQEYIDEIKNNVGRGFWLKMFEKFYINNKDKNIIITDVRFEHEVDFINNLGGRVYRIERNTDKTDTHPSETGIDLIPKNKLYGIINNNGTLDELYNSI